jgi:hypothetical protein
VVKGSESSSRTITNVEDNRRSEDNRNKDGTQPKPEKDLIPVPYSFCKGGTDSNKYCENVDPERNVGFCDDDKYDCIGDDYLQPKRDKDGNWYYDPATPPSPATTPPTTTPGQPETFGDFLGGLAPLVGVHPGAAKILGDIFDRIVSNARTPTAAATTPAPGQAAAGAPPLDGAAATGELGAESVDPTIEDDGEFSADTAGMNLVMKKMMIVIVKMKPVQ